MNESVRIRLPREQAWQLLADGEAQQIWLGPGSVLRPAEGSRVALHHAAGIWRQGAVTGVTEGREVRCRLLPAAGWGAGQRATGVVLSVETHPKGGSTVTAAETGLRTSGAAPAPQTDAEQFWRAALGRLRALAARTVRRKKDPRQAVILIHGIGEQQPGATLRSFVRGALRSIFEPGEPTEWWSKPDRASRIFELRRLTIKANHRRGRPTTDVFELYWAHVIRDTTFEQVASWLSQLILRKRVPRQLRGIWLLFWAFPVGAVALGLGWTAGWWGADWARSVAFFVGGFATAVGAGAAGVAWILRLFGKALVLDSLGDAARYLTPRPANIQHRQAIREAGVDLLRTLHEQGDFDRIVILGHSLGSVIAYDVISQYWIQVHQEHLRLPSVDNQAATQVEKALDLRGAEEAQEIQHQAWKAARANSLPWLITDLVTVGSPLSMADFLMTSRPGDFWRARKNRELPVCPPVHERRRRYKRISFDRSYLDRLGQPGRTLRLFHHAAPFAVTRWTNLHFPSRLLAGDPIGGPVRPKFGHWVRDIELAPALSRPRWFRRWFRSRKWFLHTCYWQGCRGDPHLETLIEVLRLTSSKDLLQALESHSPLMHLPSPDPTSRPGEGNRGS